MKVSTRRWVRVIGALMLALALLVLPQLVGNTYTIHLVNLAFISAVFALSLNIVLGFSGQISLGHAAFFGVGAYASALLARDAHLPVLLAILLATLIAGFFGLGVGIPTLRIGGHYLAMVTIAFGLIASVIFLNASWITGGYNGLRNVPSLGIGGMQLGGEYKSYYFLLVCAALMTAISARLKSSMLGRSMLAVREDETAAKALGVNTMVVKIQAFVLSAAFAGFAGALFAHWAGFISPDSFTIDLSISVFTMVLVGGVGSVPGVILGAALLTFLPEYLRFMKDYYRLVYGAVLVIFIIFLPGGLVSLPPLLSRWAYRWRGERPAATKGVESAKASDLTR